MSPRTQSWMDPIGPFGSFSGQSYRGQSVAVHAEHPQGALSVRQIQLQQGQSEFWGRIGPILLNEYIEHIFLGWDGKVVPVDGQHEGRKVRDLFAEHREQIVVLGEFGANRVD